MVQGPDAQPQQPEERGAASPPEGAPASPQGRPPYYRAAPDPNQTVPTPPGPFVRPANAQQPAPQQPQPYQPSYGASQPQTPPATAPPRQTALPPGYAPQPRPAPGPGQVPVLSQSAPGGAYPPPSGPAPAAAPARAVARNAALRCPNCGGPITSETETCPTCGETLQGKPRLIRCRHCGNKGSNRLTLCPHCGRTLRPAPSRWLTTALPAALVLMVLGLFAFQSDARNPFGWAGNRARAAAAWVSAFSAGLDPQLEVIPVADPNAVAALPTAPVGVAPAVVASDPAAGQAAAVTNTVRVTAGEAISLEALASAAITANASAEGAPEAGIPAATSLPTEALTPLPTEKPLPTETPAPTETPGAVSYTVVRGDAAQSIAARFGITLENLLLANNLTENEATLLQPGQTLTIPPPSAGTGSATGSLYTVREGDTLIGISVRTGVAVDVLQQANGLSDTQAASLRPGDSLVIPAPTAAPTATTAAETAPSPTPTAPTVAAVPTVRATVAAAPNGMRYPAPVLRGPQDGVTVRCDAGRLQWESVPGLQAEESFRVHLGYVSGRDTETSVQITWLIQQDIPVNITQVGVPASFCDKSSDAMGNQWRWYLEVVAGSGSAIVPVSPTSDVWGFTWRD